MTDLMSSKKTILLEPPGAGYRNIPARSVLAAAPEWGKQRFLLVRGWACAQRFEITGRTLLLDLYLPGDVIGLTPLPSCDDAVIALTDIMLKQVVVPGDWELQQLLSDALHRVMRHGMRANSFSCEDRLVDFLLDVHERLVQAGYADKEGFDLPITQAELSTLLGMSSVHLSRTIARCNKSGRVKISYGRVRITPRRMAGEEANAAIGPMQAA